MDDRSVEMIGLLGLGVLFIGLAAWVRRSRGRERSRPALAPPEFFVLFEAEACRIGEALLAFADAELEAEAARVEAREKTRECRFTRELPPGVSVVRSAVFGLSSIEVASVELAGKLRELRRASEQDAERIEAEWNYLTTALVDRFPLLAKMAQEADLPGLELLTAEPAALLGEIEERRRELTAARSALTSDKSLVWSQITLVVLTILVRDGNPDEEAAAAARVNPRPAALKDAELLQAALRFSVRVFHSVPARARAMHDGVPIPPLPDPRLAAALVRHRVSESLTGGPLEKARAIAPGEPALLWLGVPVVTACEYPHRAAEAFGKLSQAGRALIKAVEAGDRSAAGRASHDLKELALPLVGAAAAEDVAVAAAELTNGMRGEIARES